VLDEGQIRRFGRQILLREVGGRGQALLLRRPIRIEGEILSLDVAKAYLRAGGSPVDGEETDQPAIPVLAWPRHLVSGCQVVVSDGGLAFRSDRDCDGCWGLNVANLGKTHAPPVVLGALVALQVQRMVLGFEPSLGLISWLGTSMQRASVVRCSAHGTPPVGAVLK
jgi:hypothetical protein